MAAAHLKKTSHLIGELRICHKEIRYDIVSVGNSSRQAGSTGFVTSTLSIGGHRGYLGVFCRADGAVGEPWLNLWAYKIHFRSCLELD
jgi:hypothetical protein